MAIIGRLHPLLIHFPIVLVFVAVAAETISILRQDSCWRSTAVGNLRGAAAFAALAAGAGWRLAAAGDIDGTALLEWHRWLGTAGAAVTAAAAERRPVPSTFRIDRRYRVALLAAAGLVGVAGHLGGLLVWGVDFFRL